MKYRVFFSLFGKNLQTTIDADNEAEVKDKIRSMVRFDKIELTETDTDMPDFFADLLGKFGDRR